MESFGLHNWSFIEKKSIVLRCKLINDVGGVKVDAITYKQMVGSLMYLTVTRLGLMYVLSLVACFVEASTTMHQQIVNMLCVI